MKDWKHAEFLSVLILAEIGLPLVPNCIFIYVFPRWRRLQPDIVLDLLYFLTKSDWDRWGEIPSPALTSSSEMSSASIRATGGVMLPCCCFLESNYNRDAEWKHCCAVVDGGVALA